MSDGCISDSHLFHYFLRPTDSATLERIRVEGLRSLSDQPEQAERLRAIEQAVPGHFARLYHDWARPVLHRPYDGRTGVFLTPIDFRQIPESWLRRRSRVVVPLQRLDIGDAVLTYDEDGQRVSLALNRDALIQARELWPVSRVVAQFGVDHQRLFFLVPQVVTYQSKPIPVHANDIDITTEDEPYD